MSPEKGFIKLVCHPSTDEGTLASREVPMLPLSDDAACSSKCTNYLCHYWLEGLRQDNRKGRKKERQQAKAIDFVSFVATYDTQMKISLRNITNGTLFGPKAPFVVMNMMNDKHISIL